MTTCKDCTHFSVCKLYDLNILEDLDLLPEECGHFKSAATGTWVDAYDIRKSKCSACGVAFCRVMEDCNYCPTCGANMIEETANG